MGIEESGLAASYPEGGSKSTITDNRFSFTWMVYFGVFVFFVNTDHFSMNLFAGF